MCEICSQLANNSAGSIVSFEHVNEGWGKYGNETRNVH